MKKLVLCVGAYLIAALSYKYVMAGETSSKETVVHATDNIRKVYEQIDFSSKTAMDFDVFEKAYQGYAALKHEGKLSDNKDILTVCDMSKSSKEYRLWVIDMTSKKVLINDYVAHGQGSGDEFATQFSNRNNSHQSSLGFYVTGDTYIGGHGLSLRLHGMDKGYNNAAYERAIVVHGARYVCDDFVAGQGRLGRSWGCPAVSEKISAKLIETIKDGTCMFIYYPHQKYLQASYWLNRKPDYSSDFILASAGNADTSVVYEYSPAMKKIAGELKYLNLPLF